MVAVTTHSQRPRVLFAQAVLRSARSVGKLLSPAQSGKHSTPRLKISDQ